ncbi:hypothetical protein [Deinococcus apachensis]|uniref:hypothetical protein n=1 Tax=Deinococcus apachensis TaxID=309886 RepID=UPI0003722D4D|nr:hypothetical protein [Deinococcus apachensis]
MPPRARQALLLAALLAIPASLTTPAARAQPSFSNSPNCQTLLTQIGSVRNFALQSRSRIIDSLSVLDQRPLNNDRQAQAQAKSTLLAALYTGDAAHFDALVRLYLGVCVIPAAPR